MTSTTAPLLLMLLLVPLVASAAAAATPDAAAANSRLPSSCLRDAAALCQGSSTYAMTCLVKLAAAGDARVSKTCGTALDATAKLAASGKEEQYSRSRVEKLHRMLTEAPPSQCTSAPCVGTAARTHTVNSPSGAVYVADTAFFTCGDVCCTAGANNPSAVCCITNTSTTFNTVWCVGAAHQGF